MKKIMLLVLSIVLISCAGHKGDTGESGTPGNVVVVNPPTPNAIDSLIADENAYRAISALAPLTKGLSCTLYTVTGGDRIQSTIPGHDTLTGLSSVVTWLYGGVFNQPNSNAAEGLNVLPMPYKSIYLNLFLLRCIGSIVIIDSGLTGFELASDDASVLYIDGAKVIDNDNAHGVTVLSGVKMLRRGVHTFRLDFAQTGAGSQALILKMNAVLLSSSLMFH